jgi:hypothetical protein
MPGHYGAGQYLERVLGENFRGENAWASARKARSSLLEKIQELQSSGASIACFYSSVASLPRENQTRNQTGMKEKKENATS